MKQYNIGNRVVLATSQKEAEKLIKGFGTHHPADMKMTTSQVKQVVTTRVILRLNTLAWAWQYHDYSSAMTYVGSKVAKYNKEATKIQDWVSDTWSALEAINSTLKATPKVSQLEMWLKANIFDKLPPEPTRPK